MKFLALTSLVFFALTSCKDEGRLIDAEIESRNKEARLALIEAPKRKLPIIRSSDLEVTEGDDMHPVVALKVTLNKKSHVPVGVTYHTVEASAKGPEHYLPVRGRLVFSPGETFKHLEIQVNSDRVANGNRHFFVQLSSPTNGVIAGDGKYQIDIHDDLTDAPAVTGVYVSANIDPATFAPIEVGDGSTQLKNVAIQGIKYIQIRFSTDVLVAKNDLIVNNSAPGKSYTLRDFSYDEDSYSAIWGLDSDIDADRLRLILNSGKITARLTGIQLDGTWINPKSYDDLRTGSSYPSGGSGPGTNFEFHANILSCDFNQDDMVDKIDLSLLWEKFENESYDPAIDTNQDGTLDELDIKTCENSMGTKLTQSSL